MSEQQHEPTWEEMTAHLLAKQAEETITVKKSAWLRLISKALKYRICPPELRYRGCNVSDECADCWRLWREKAEVHDDK